MTDVIKSTLPRKEWHELAEDLLARFPGVDRCRLIPVPVGAKIRPWHWWKTPELSMTESEREYYHGNPLTGETLEASGKLYEVRIPNK